MNEFLKNFRNAQSSRYAGKKNPYDGHYYSNHNPGDLRSGNERRSPRNISHNERANGSAQNSLFQKVEELLPVVKDILEMVMDHQEEFYELKRRQEENMTMIANAFQEMAAAFSNSEIPKKEPRPVAEKKEKIDSKSDVYSLEDIEKEGMQSAASKKREVIKLMKKLRKKGGTYKEIANFLNEKDIPTFSNNGKWHAQTIHRLCGK